MSREEAYQLLAKAITEIQEQSGREVGNLNEDIRPFTDLDGFDSLNGVEVKTLLLEDICFDDKLNFFSPIDGREITLGEIADRIAAVAKAKEMVS